MTTPSPDPSAMAIDLLAAARAGEPVQVLVQEIACLERGLLRASLPDDDARRAFWLNLYNAWIHALAMTPAGAGTDGVAADVFPLGGPRGNRPDLPNPNG